MRDLMWVVLRGDDRKPLESARCELRGIDEPESEVIQMAIGALPSGGEGMLVLKVPGYKYWAAIGEQGYQPVSYRVLKVVEAGEHLVEGHRWSQELRCEKVARFDQAEKMPSKVATERLARIREALEESKEKVEA